MDGGCRINGVFVLCPQVRKLLHIGTVQCASTTTRRSQTFCTRTLMQVTTRTISVSWSTDNNVLAQRCLRVQRERRMAPMILWLVYWGQRKVPRIVTPRLLSAVTLPLSPHFPDSSQRLYHALMKVMPIFWAESRRQASPPGRTMRRGQFATWQCRANSLVTCFHYTSSYTISNAHSFSSVLYSHRCHDSWLKSSW